ncbi:hypothetical protein CLF_109655 [Clonorchis sinensis]|uniref:Uncharacterized protein n=1 Tax=Clonorchis sinensis TaxID=79923 RepID=G7YST4_CLOSI|nr:hypothetical protein CLF_109655 [Clonorchis sinensis]
MTCGRCVGVTFVVDKSIKTLKADCVHFSNVENLSVTDVSFVPNSLIAFICHTIVGANTSFTIRKILLNFRCLSPDCKCGVLLLYVYEHYLTICGFSLHVKGRDGFDQFIQKCQRLLLLIEDVYDILCIFRIHKVAVDLFAELGNWLANVSSPYEETSSVRSWVGTSSLPVCVYIAFEDTSSPVTTEVNFTLPGLTHPLRALL